jgi:hypothetical protein
MFMDKRIILDCVLIVGFAFFGFYPCDRNRVRAPWAKIVFLICGIIGVARGAIALAWDLGWFSLGRAAGYKLDGLLNHFIDGLLLGFILSLILSRQLLGTKKSSDAALGTTP